MTGPRLDGFVDLGALEPPILVFGGPYSNRQATEALRAVAAGLGIPPESTLCTGDVVAYGGDPDATATAIRDWGVHVVRGNCEESVAAGADNCGCGFPEDSACDLLSRAWYAFALANTADSSRLWMGGLPAGIAFTLAGIRVAAVHGSVDDPSRFIFASTDPAAKQADMEHLAADVMITGHSGIPFTQSIGGRIWHNAGVIGLPANDGTPDVWYSIVDADGTRLTIRHYRLSYDFRSAADAMRRHGLPEAYADSLATGLWPSIDILPPPEASEQGRPLNLDGKTLAYAMVARRTGGGALLTEQTALD